MKDKRKCPLKIAWIGSDRCWREKCAIYDAAHGCCSFLSIATALTRGDDVQCAINDNGINESDEKTA